MKLIAVARSLQPHSTLPKLILPSSQLRFFQPDYAPRDPNAIPKRYKYPPFYDPYGPRPPPSDKIIQIADKIAALPVEERRLIGPTLAERLSHPKLQQISVDGLDAGAAGGAAAGSSKVEEKKEKTAFDVKLEKCNGPGFRNVMFCCLGRYDDRCPSFLDVWDL